MILVGNEGAPSARIVLVGEAPGKQEELHGRPFIGPSGGRLMYWWRLVGLERPDFFITNVLPFRPENIADVSKEEFLAYFERLHDTLNGLDEPWIIVPTGNYALYALTGKGKVHWHAKDGRYPRPGITDWRGSLLSYTMRNGRVVKVVPTLHPAHVLRNPRLEHRAVHDWQLIVQEVATPELQLPVRHHAISPDVPMVLDFVAEAIASGDPISLDIETPKGQVTQYEMLDGTKRTRVLKRDLDKVARYKGGKKKGQVKSKRVRGKAYLGCVGVSYDPAFSLTIPLTKDYWKNADDYRTVRAAVRMLLASENEKIMQNGMFDTGWLTREGFPVANWVWDTRVMHYVVDARDDHDLAYLGSIYTRQPFWKHEAKDPDEIMKYAFNNEALWTYCGIDTCVTLEAYRALRNELETMGQIDFYRRFCASRFPVLVDMMMHGIQVDEECRRLAYTTLTAEAHTLRGQIAQHAFGMPVITSKGGLSNDRLKYLFYGQRGFEGTRAEKSYEALLKKYPDVQPFNCTPLRRRSVTTKKNSITVDEVAIRRLSLKHPETAGVIGPLLLAYRENRKRIEVADGRAVGEDGRMRCQFSLVTEAGRLSSQATPWGEGRNLQNIEAFLRTIFVPDKESV